jgi:anti-sigma regulatory factor (Ser/Thr protein kinase)
MPPKNLSFKLKNDISELDELGRKLTAFGNGIGLSKKCIFQINLALDELFTNIVSYGFPDNGPQWISVTLSHDNSMICVRLEDTGVPFDPSNAETPDPITEIEDCKVGGLGLHLVNKVMDKITYTRRNRKNIITLVKHIPKS